MNPAVSIIQRVVKIALGLAMLSWLFIGEGESKYMGIIGLAPLISGLTNSCGGATGCRTNFREKEVN
ncbi:MAG: DUF2892 domain-containing protein [Bacteroidota bacterium]|jgi:hypothetical protein|nr:DUF2892 domain-containing protein [Ignavibacteria bacterium]HEX2962473.1 DUF2892 domain-containing protein [Ignavibacteriales bacterium]MCU7500855.1 DUF2892 domain-containing protein [Ignavibacteria bacterium]MCU7511766.1 DUF2892 domain-containing protein [Ignavibacteria bacterium]MCU7520666.1 DUF2892 domain-containing protein [Ignavibacteria bacterium]